MADAITAVIGAVLVSTFVLLIAVKLNEFPLWVVVLTGLALMLAAFWIDAWRPLFKRAEK
jgi:uncharacterized membrane protein